MIDTNTDLYAARDAYRLIHREAELAAARHDQIETHLKAIKANLTERAADDKTLTNAEKRAAWIRHELEAYHQDVLDDEADAARDKREKEAERDRCYKDLTVAERAVERETALINRQTADVMVSYAATMLQAARLWSTVPAVSATTPSGHPTNGKRFNAKEPI